MPKIYVYGSRDKLENYANALEGSGLEGLFSLDISQAEECDGLLLPGGGDIDPARYGQLPAGSVDPDVIGGRGLRTIAAGGKHSGG